MSARTADVVIVGGGVTGVSIAYHLAQRGVRDVAVVDKGALASGGTGKSSACVRQHYSTAETCRMIRYSLDFFQHFAERVDGASCGFRHTGYLLGVDEKMRAPIEAPVALQRSVGIDTKLVSPVNLRELEPRLRIDDLVGSAPDGPMLETAMPLIEVNVPHQQTIDEARRRLETAVHQVSTQFQAMIHRVEWAQDRNRVRLEGPGAWVEIWIDARNVHAKGDVAIVGALLGAPLTAGLRRILQDTFPKALP